MASVHIVLVNWNGWRDTVECLESLLRLQEDDFCVTICDNGSTDKSVANILSWLDGKVATSVGSKEVWSRIGTVRHRQPSYRLSSVNGACQRDTSLITIIDTQKNLGFAGGNNIGIRQALADPECRYIWLLNNDTVVAPNALASLQRLMDAEPDVAICGSTLLFYDSPDTVQALGAHYNFAKANPLPIGIMRSVDDLPSRAEVEAQISYVVGASMLVRRSVFERTRGLSEDYFLYFEEIDLAYRLQGKERQAWSPQSIVYHKESKSIGPRSGARLSDTGLYYMLVNCLRFYRKYRFPLLPVAIARLAWEAFKAVRVGDWTGLRIVKLAAMDFISGHRRIGFSGLGHERTGSASTGTN